MTAAYAVVLAGGESRRFGSDKLAADTGGTPLLERTVAGLPPDLTVLVVGPPRELSRSVRYVREDPPGGGPAAGLVAGLLAALADGAEEVVVLPGDAPDAGPGAVHLLAALRAQEPPWAVVATDHAGVLQPLQLALHGSAAAALVAGAGAAAAAGASARSLVAGLIPPAEPVALDGRLTRDIDTTDQLRDWARARPASRADEPRTTGGS